MDLDLELVVGVLAVSVMLAGLGLWARVAARRGNDRKSKALGFLAGVVMEVVFVWTAVLMWRHVLADGSHLFEAVASTVLAVAGVLAVVVDVLKALPGARRPGGPTHATGNGRARDLARR